MAQIRDLYEQIILEMRELQGNCDYEKLINKHIDLAELDCLLNPGRHPLVYKDGQCDCEDQQCLSACVFNALSIDDNGQAMIDSSKCLGCSRCVNVCSQDILVQSKDLVAVMLALKEHQGPVFAINAPALEGQFGSDVEIGQIRAALKTIGFTGLVEVAISADLLTLKEALELKNRTIDDNSFTLTSCCCPMWVAMIQKYYEQIVEHVPPSVSPMIATARIIKKLYPDALVVFIGPCIAKKAESRIPDLAGAVDFVLTFEELAELFNIFKFNLSEFENDMKNHSSACGLMYGYEGGVSKSVIKTLYTMAPELYGKIKTKHVAGVPECKAILADIVEGKIEANFYEGMGCAGGCVGGPKRLVSKEQGYENLANNVEQASYATPLDNPYVIELAEQLGLGSVESFIHHSDILTREIPKK